MGPYKARATSSARRSTASSRGRTSFSSFRQIFRWTVPPLRTPPTPTPQVRAMVAAASGGALTLARAACRRRRRCLERGAARAPRLHVARLCAGCHLESCWRRARRRHSSECMPPAAALRAQQPPPSHPSYYRVSRPSLVTRGALRSRCPALSSPPLICMGSQVRARVLAVA